jgi:hypothetical protein
MIIPQFVGEGASPGERVRAAERSGRTGCIASEFSRELGKLRKGIVPQVAICGRT